MRDDMPMSLVDDLDALVSLETGEVARAIFSDEDIFNAEIDRIFGRAWLFLCHESQLPEPGDFFESIMGRDNVLVVRQKDGSLKAFLNSCTHRGNAVCRAEEGNARSFLCTYHGWSFGIDGRLKGVPGYKDLYHSDFDKSDYNLVEIAQLDSYRGFVFGTLDPDAPPLSDFLGATGRLGLEQIAARGHMEVIPGIQKFRIECNWKFAQDNCLDWYHPQVTHSSAMREGILPGPKRPELQHMDQDELIMQDGSELAMARDSGMSGTRFPSVAVIGEYGHSISGPTTDAHVGEHDPSWRYGVSERIGEDLTDIAGHPQIFPNTWVAATAQLSLRIPISPTVTEFWWFSFVDRNLPADKRRRAVVAANRVFGPAGILEQDDGENWAQSTMQTFGAASRNVPVRINMGLGRGEVDRSKGVPRIDSVTNEHAQLWLYECWKIWMKAPSWSDLRTATEPPERL